DEATAGLSEQFAGDLESVAQVAEVTVDAEFPGITEGFDLFSLAGSVLGLTILHVALTGTDLPVGTELDAVRRVDVDHLDLAAQLLPLSKRSHNLQGVAQDQAV